MPASDEDSFENWDIFSELADRGLDITLDDPDLVGGDAVVFSKKEEDGRSDG